MVRCSRGIAGARSKEPLEESKRTRRSGCMEDIELIVPWPPCQSTVYLYRGISFKEDVRCAPVKVGTGKSLGVALISS